MRLVTLMAFAFIAGTALAPAGEFNSLINIGDPAPQWDKLIGVDDKLHSSSETNDYRAVVVAFTCNSCPYAGDAEDRLVWLHENYSARDVAIVAINVNTIDEDSLEAMKQKAIAKSFEFTYLYDETQQIAKRFGAKYTPEFFVLGKADDDGKRNVVYMGSMDDSPDGKNVTKPYVASAIDAVLAGKSPEITETVPIGCQIRFKRERRTRKPKQLAPVK
ncbi:thioredoxin family protein [Rubripirellula reticaptiva]|uniref:AhpC/TSA family protein n=1 Tax=Rubripirellula reticaptiva TaxID=2528013 RepID=A0A5C6F4J8_9BACT|nr:thioredoxin family protein [Rubripirellula reticaptiva]TWU55440.1 AhpC/TSA family protein [Rubripirellula reticaptiva]